MRLFCTLLFCLFAFNLTVANAFQKAPEKITPAKTLSPVGEAAIVRQTATTLAEFYSKCTAFYSIQFIIYDKSAGLNVDPLIYKQKTANSLILARAYAGLLKYDEEEVTKQTAQEAKNIIALVPDRKLALGRLTALFNQCEAALADPKKTMLEKLRQYGAPEIFK